MIIFLYKSIISILFTYFIDYLGWSIVFPIFAPFFLDPKNIIFSSAVSVTTRTAILGFFLAIFPLAQFFGAPILGELADRTGRKKSLLLSLFFILIGYFLSAYSIHVKSLIFLFISRLITGVFSGNLSICIAAISDLSKDEKLKVKSFGHLAVLAGLAFILGTFIGGKFSDNSVSQYFSPALPFLIAAILCTISFLLILFAFEETIEPEKGAKFDLLLGIHNIQEALKLKKLKIIYLVYFLFLFGWAILLQFSPVLLIQKFSFTNSQIGDLAAFMGICYALGSSFILNFLSKKFNLTQILEASFILFTCFIMIVAFPSEKYAVMAILGISVALAGVAWPLCTSLISNIATKRMQGKILGISQSMQSLAMAFAPVVAGFADRLYFHLPFIIAGVATLISALIYFKIKV
jgi:DHA1 family tetracycline resistance protein-like MFS transporter